MQIQFSQKEQDFCAQVDGFIAQYWPAESQVIGARGAVHVQAWYKAVANAGWSVPHWPVKFGGAQWSPVQHYIWHSRCMTANAPPTRTFATEHVGPLLTECLPEELFAKYLTAIRDFSAGWCLGWMEAQWPDLSERMQTTLTEANNDAAQTNTYVLSGEKRAVLGVLGAKWILVGYQPINPSSDAVTHHDMECGLCIVDLHAPGVDVRSSSAAQSQFGTVTFTDVVVNSAEILPVSGQSFVQRIAQRSSNSEQYSGLSTGPVEAQAKDVAVAIHLVAPALQRQLTDIQGYIDAQGYIDDEELGQEINELGVDLATLHALEMRILAEAESAAPRLSPLVAQIAARKIRAKLGALQVASFGYYALPDFDARLFDNEGPLNPQAHIYEQNASSHVGQGLASIGGDRDEFELKDTLAGSELGLNDTSGENR